MRESRERSDAREEVARQAGAEWSGRMRAQYERGGRTLSSWPGTLEDARRLIDATLGTALDEDERERLALLAELGARRVWLESSGNRR